MSIFEEVGIKWGDEEYLVPADRVMELVEVVEEVVTIEELSASGVKRVKVARAFAAAVRYAAQCSGTRINVTEEDVFKSFFGTGAMVATTQVIYGLLSFMIPPEHLQTKPKTNPKAKKKAPRKKSAKGSSKKRT